MEKYLTEQIDSLFTPWNRTDTPGCVLGIFQDGRISYTKAYGMANLEYGLALTPDSLMYLASNSKQFMAACVMLLVQQGLVSLSDDIRKYFPEMPEYPHPVRVEHILNHTNGWREHGYLSFLAGMSDLDYRTADSVAMICRQSGVNYPAGETYLYSNAGFVLQAELVQRVTGQALPSFTRQNLFEPLGMRSTVFSDDHGLVLKNRAASYEPAENGGYRCLLAANSVLGSAGVLTTVEDLYRWDQNFYDARVGGPEFIRLMTTPAHFNDGRQVPYSAGLIHSEICGQKAISHGGVEFGYRSNTLRFPERRLSIMCLANLSTFRPAEISEQIAGLLLSEQKPVFVRSPKPQPQPLSTAVVEGASGFYYDSVTGAFARLPDQDGHLWASAAGFNFEPELVTHSITPEKETFTLEYEDRAEAFLMRFTLEKAHAAFGWTLLPVMMECSLPALAQTPVADAAALNPEEFAGRFYCADVKALYETAVVDGRLSLVNLTGLRGELSAGPADVFTRGGWSLHFTRAGDGRVDGFRLWNLSVRGLRFERIEVR